MSRQLSEEARLKRNEYIRNWRKNNKDKVKQYNDRHWENLVAKEVERRLEEVKAASGNEEK